MLKSIFYHILLSLTKTFISVQKVFIMVIFRSLKSFIILFSMEFLPNLTCQKWGGEGSDSQEYVRNGGS